MSKTYKFVEPEVKEQQMVEALEKGLGRELTALEARKIKWISECEYDTSGVLLDLFKELSNMNAKRGV